MHPKTLEKHLNHGLENHNLVHNKYTSKQDDGVIRHNYTIHEKTTGKNVGSMKRLYSLDENGNKIVEHDHFELDPNHQGKHLAKHILHNSMKLYKKMGIHSIHTFANIDVGGYAWAKYGFYPNRKSQLEYVQKQVHNRIGSDDKGHYVKTHGEHEYIPHEHANHIHKLLKSKDPKSIYHLADMSHKMKDGKSLGNHLLRGSNWHAHLPLHDKDAMHRFHSYIGEHHGK
jgi:hypothetical protein